MLPPLSDLLPGWSVEDRNDLDVPGVCRTLLQAMAWVRWEGSCTCGS